MPRQIQGFSPARLTGEYVRFHRKLPEITPGATYTAKFLDPAELGTFIRTRRGRISREKIAEKANISNAAIYETECGKSSLTFPRAARVHAALGGRALYLAFFPEGTNFAAPARILAASPEGSELSVRRYFSQQLTEQGLAQGDITTQSLVSDFENTDNPTPIRPARMPKFFNPLGIQVTYLSVWN